MGGLTPQDLPAHNPVIESIDIDGDVLLYDGEHLRLLAGTAAHIWQAIDGCRSVQQLIRSMHGGGDPLVEQDVLAFLEELLDLVLIHVLSPDASARFVRSDDVAYVVDGEQTLLLHLASGRRATLPGSGSQVWELLVGQLDPVDVIASLRLVHPEAETLSQDVHSLLDDLVEAGFLRRSGPAGRSSAS